MKAIAHATLVAALFLSTHALATEAMSASHSSRICRSYLFGMRHIEAPAAGVHAKQAAQTFATRQLQQACDKQQGMLQDINVDATCTHPTDQKSGPFDLSVCVTCEAKATGLCTY